MTSNPTDILFFLLSTPTTSPLTIQLGNSKGIRSTQLHVIITQHLFISNQMFFSTIDQYTMNQSRSVIKDHEFSGQHTQKGP